MACSVSWAGKVLLCRRAQEPAKGKWNVPTGFLECGEALEEGAARETLEETGVVVDPLALELHGVLNMLELNQVHVGFRVEILEKPVLRPGPESLEAAFFSEDEMPPEELAWQNCLGTAAPRWFHENRSHNYSISLSTLSPSRSLDFRSREYLIKSVRGVR